MTTQIIVTPTHKCQVIEWDMSVVDSNGKEGQIVRAEVLEAGGPQMHYYAHGNNSISVTELSEDENGEPAMRAAREYQGRVARGSDSVSA